MSRSLLSLGLCLLMVCAGCSNGNGLTPRSGGRPYEVLVIGANSEAVAMVVGSLRDLKMEGLPQQEAVFDVSTIVSDGLTQATRYARNIVMVTTGIDSLKHATVSYQQNTYARPQLILHLRAASTSQLRSTLLYNVRAIKRQLVLQELNNGIALLRDKHNKAAETMVREMFGARLWVPEDLNKWKRGQDFLWLSNDAARGMQNICIYRYAGNVLTREQAIAKRDSMMKLNLPGESEGSYMKTAPYPAVAVDNHSEKTPDGIRPTELRGLWEMQGEAMGGPFVSLSTRYGDSTLVVEAFVYAPETEKRRMVRRLEASLHTLNIEH